MLFKWKDGLEGYIPLKTLRQKCPCANCEGEKDVFGNIYKGELKPISEEGFILKGLQPVGYYALRPFWLDGHHAGICLLYTSPSPRDATLSRMPSSA